MNLYSVVLLFMLTETESLILDNAAENTDRRDSCKSTSEQEKDDSSTPNSHVAPINSFSSLWMEEMEINWRKKVIRDDLRSLRDFLIAGMDISVMEEKVSFTNCSPTHNYISKYKISCTFFSLFDISQ